MSVWASELAVDSVRAGRAGLRFVFIRVQQRPDRFHRTETFVTETLVGDLVADSVPPKSGLIQFTVGRPSTGNLIDRNLQRLAGVS